MKFFIIMMICLGLTTNSYAKKFGSHCFTQDLSSIDQGNCVYRAAQNGRVYIDYLIKKSKNTKEVKNQQLSDSYIEQFCKKTACDVLKCDIGGVTRQTYDCELEHINQRIRDLKWLYPDENYYSP